MNTATILVVDDEPQLRRTMKATLTDLGYSVIEARTGEEAIETLRRDPADLILLDLNMPGKSGLEVLKWIRNQPGISMLLVVVLTSSNQDSDIHRAYIQGTNGYLVKPSKPDEMLAMARAIKDYWLDQNRTPKRNIPPGGALSTARP